LIVHNAWKTWVKWLWWGLVILFIGLFLYDNFAETRTVLGKLPLSVVTLSLAALISGKFLLVAIMHQALARHRVFFPMRRCFDIYNLTQLGKYIPGSIWQFVGRIGLYKEAGLPHAIIRDAILLETFWVVSSAFLIGVLLTGWSQHALILTLFDRVPWIIWLVLSATVLILLLVVLAGPWRTKLLGYASKFVFSPAALLITGCVWLMMGLAFWLTLLPFTSSSMEFLFVVGLYALSYGIGFVVPFAPAGLGIREAVLVLGLMPTMPTETAIVLASLNRILYIVSEIFLAGAAILLPAGAGNQPEAR
jgi:hypothetical protein